MCQFAVQISIVLALLAHCACAIKVNSDSDVAVQDSNVYSPTCTTDGVAKDIFWNFNNCTACGFSCIVTGGDSVYNKIAVTLAGTLVDPTVVTTFYINGIPVSRSKSVMTASFPADQLYAVESWATVPKVVFPALYKITFEVTQKGQSANKVACASCGFRIA